MKSKTGAGTARISEVTEMKKIFGVLTAAVICASSVTALPFVSNDINVSAEEWCYAGETCEPLHDTSRDIQTEGVGNPLNFGERNTPADASTAEIRAINHKMTVQEVKYALYKEIDEHWDLISTRLGQPEREKMYALFLGLGSRESTLGEGKIGSDHETAYEDGWGVNSAHAYGTLQTAVTAFAGCDPKFMPEDNVPEMFQYSFTPQNFYDCIISNHMGIRKILHFVEICINEEHMHGYQVIRNSLKGFNTGWCYMAEDDGAYKTYADEICSMAQFYYNEGHLYDNVFTWTSAGGEMEKYRTADRWSSWWGDGEPSMAPIEEKQQTPTETTEPVVTTTTSESTASSTYTTTTEAPVVTTMIKSSMISEVITDYYGTGDANCDGEVSLADAVLIMQALANPSKYGKDGTDTNKITLLGLTNADCSNVGDGMTNKDALAIQKFMLNIISSLPEETE